eukprot:TRINITY_DN316_c0_g1_i1.p2 TRINITY_DN316_c0_g1~~TRINITY_DN316_c0_g1_i1.p2  ORF type:complete len:133 (+),score=14.44 TRINITY_DN316_c0_g1_i1:1077-1475(+)
MLASDGLSATQKERAAAIQGLNAPLCRLLEGLPGCNLFLGFSPSPSSLQAVARWRNPEDPRAAPVVQTALIGDKLFIPLEVIRENIPQQLEANATRAVEFDIQLVHLGYKSYLKLYGRGEHESLDTLAYKEG